MKHKLICVGGMLVASIAVAVNGTWNWASTATPDGKSATAMADWSNPAYWVNDTLPSGDTSVAYIVPTNQASKLNTEGPRWIRVPEAGVDLGEINTRKNATVYFSGGPLRFGESSDAGYTFPRIRDEGTSCSLYFFCPIDLSRKATTLNKANFCGPFAYAGKTSTLASSNFINWYGHLWATNASGTAVDPFPECLYSIGSGRVRFFGRNGAAAQTGYWKTIEGSPVLVRVGDAHDLAAGASVSGTGIPDGAFVKSIYDNSTIEISANCTASSDDTGVEVSFGAIPVAVTRQRITRLQNQAGDTTTMAPFLFTKFRAEDVFEVRIGTIADGVELDHESDGSISCHPCLTKDHFPAKLYIESAIPGKGKLTRFVRSDIVFDPQDSDTISLGPVEFARGGDNKSYGCSSRFEVPEGVSAVVGSVERWTLDVVKAGAGTFDLTVPSWKNSYTLVCEEGTTVLRMTSPDADQTLSSLSVASGAVFKLAEGTLAVASLETASGAVFEAGEGAVLDLSGFDLPEGVVLKGPGKFILAGTQQAVRSKLEGNPELSFKNPGTSRDLITFERLDPGVVGHPAFWVMADKNVDLMTFERNGTTYENGVACWRDCRDGETTYYATNDFSQLVETTGVPSLRKDFTYNGKTSPGIAHFGMLPAPEDNYRKVQSGMVWNKPITNICAVFSVVVSRSDGANAILGSTKRFEEMGTARLTNDFVRGVNSKIDGGGIGSWNNVYILSPNAPEHIRKGWIYADGVLKSPDDNLSEFSYFDFVVLEMHPLPPYGRADAFAIQEHGGVTCSGCQIQLECIVYTNELTQTERMKVCSYLLSKWKGKLLPAVDSRVGGIGRLDGADFTDGAVLNTGEGEVLGLTSATNVSVVKTGSGALYVDFVDGAELDVREGVLNIRSVDNSESCIPSGQFIHLDASKTNTMEFKSYQFRGETIEKMVETWRDPQTNRYAHTRRSDGRYRPGYLTYPEELGGLPVVDYSTLTNAVPGTATKEELSAGCFHDFYTGSGDRSDAYAKTTAIGSMFMMIGSKNGGGLPLGEYSTAAWRVATDDPSVPFLGASAPIGLRRGEGFLNGVRVSLTETGLSGGYDTVSIRNISGIGGAGIQNIMMGYSRRYMGGGEIGELLIYETPLDYATHKLVDSYLGRKWFGRKTPAFSPSEVESLAVAAGAEVCVDGDAPITVEALSGAGTIDGSVICAEGCVVTATVTSSGDIETLSVTGSLDATRGGVVQVSGDARLLEIGSYPVIAASSLTFGGTWTTVCDCGNSLKAVVRVRENSLCLEIIPVGTLITVK